MKLLTLMASLLFTTACIGATVWLLHIDESKGRLVEASFPDPTNRFAWMDPLVTNNWQSGDPPAYRDDPEWQRIPFGHNAVTWLNFRRGKFGWNWNEFVPEKLILQSSFEPFVTKTNGVWLVQFTTNHTAL